MVKPSLNTLNNWIYDDKSQRTNRTELARVKEAFESLPDKIVEFKVGTSDLRLFDPAIKKSFQ